MGIKQTVYRLSQYIRQHVSKRAVLVSISFLSFAAYIIAFAPRSITFSYSDPITCVNQLSLFPRLIKVEENSSYKVTITDTIDIAGYPIIGRKVCVTPLQAPKKSKVQVSMAPFGWILGRKTYVINTPQAPVVSIGKLKESIPVAESLKVPISAKDAVYSYSLVAGNGSTGCESTDRALTCDVSKMQLIQGSTYALKIERSFNDYHETVGEKSVKVLDPVKVEQSSIKADQIMYDKPAAVTIQTTKPVGEVKATLERLDGDAVKEEKVSVAAKDTQITVTFTGELAREAKYQLKITYAKGTDGSMLAEPYVLPFELSGGPKVTGVNIGTFGVPLGQVVTIQFDQPIKTDQDITKFVQVNGTAAAITKSGSRVTIQPTNASACQAFSIAVNKGLLSEYDIVGSQPWQYSSRMRCSIVATIGTSVKGRPIYAYSFGNGANTILFTGAIHGNELSGKYTMDSWISYLEEHAPEIPADRRVVIVPMVNPDGVAANTRNNASNVNLNRNFATSDWVTDTSVSGGGTEKGAGGSSAMSEPETVALAALTQRLQPRFVVSYHSLGSLVNSNDVGIAATLGPKYASLTGYKYVPSTATGDAFDYNVTGTYEDWLAERGTPAILIELPTNTGQYLTRNVDAMWSIVRG